MCYENGIARGVYYHQNRDARGVPFMDNTPGDMDNIGKECRLPFIYTLYMMLVWVKNVQHY